MSKKGGGGGYELLEKKQEAGRRAMNTNHIICVLYLLYKIIFCRHLSSKATKINKILGGKVLSFSLFAKKSEE